MAGGIIENPTFDKLRLRMQQHFGPRLKALLMPYLEKSTEALMAEASGAEFDRDPHRLGLILCALSERV